MNKLPVLLKPCPFCGNKEPILDKDQLFMNPELTDGEKEYIEAYVIRCGKCSAYMRLLNETNISEDKQILTVIKWWNRRS